MIDVDSAVDRSGSSFIPEAARPRETRRDAIGNLARDADGAMRRDIVAGTRT